MSNTRYEVVLGPNTNQWWIYDNEEDVYIDPPKDVLDAVKEFDEGKQEYLEAVISACPMWLADKDRWYTDIEI